MSGETKRPGSTARSHPTEFRGYEGDNVRPADNRYLTDAQIAKRDEYVAEETGDQAQQLIAKEEAARAAIAEPDVEPEPEPPAA